MKCDGDHKGGQINRPPPVAKHSRRAAPIPPFHPPPRPPRGRRAHKGDQLHRRPESRGEADETRIAPKTPTLQPASTPEAPATKLRPGPKQAGKGYHAWDERAGLSHPSRGPQQEPPSRLHHQGLAARGAHQPVPRPICGSRSCQSRPTATHVVVPTR